MNLKAPEGEKQKLPVLWSSLLAIAALALAFAMPAKAQLSDNGYANVDWQFNAPLKNHFADKASGWGMNFEGGYFVTPNLGLGLFMNYSSNHEYFPRATFPVGEGTVNTDQQHTIFQLPFGAAARYQMNRGGAWQPYFGVKLGLNVYPWAYGPGLHIAVYYSYATNKANVLTYNVDKLNNFGFRVGLAF